MTFYFCPTCGSTVYWEDKGFPGYVAVAIGNFADPNFPAPNIAVREESRHPWIALPPDTPAEARGKAGVIKLSTRSHDTSFGTRGSQVQILPLRPSNPKHLAQSNR